MNPRYGRVADRAEHRCEYCFAPESSFNSPFEVEHIVPLLHHGEDNESNWALACRSCNLHKGAAITSTDPETGNVAPLFHPRRERWSEHFRIDNEILIGLTSVGKATVLRLNMNSAHQIAAR